MATTDLSDLSARQLEKTKKEAEKAFSQLEAADVSKILREGKGPETLAAMRAAVKTRSAAQAELAQRSRAVDAAIRGAPVRKRFEEEARTREQRKADMKPAVRALGRITLPPGVLNLDPSKLTPEQGEELFEIVFSEELRSPAQQSRQEALIELAGDAPGLFERLRQEGEIAAKEAKLAEETRFASLPERTYTGRGGVYLPAELVHDVVEARDDGMTAFRLGVLAAILLGIENKIPTLVGARVEDDEFVGASEPLRIDPRDGSLGVTDAIHYLKLNEWIETDREGGELRIRRGKRALALLEGGESVT